MQGNEILSVKEKSAEVAVADDFCLVGNADVSAFVLSVWDRKVNKFDMCGLLVEKNICRRWQVEVKIQTWPPLFALAVCIYVHQKHS